MESPFAAWLPMYGAGVVPERPWWRTPMKEPLSVSFFGGGGAPRPDPSVRVRADGRRVCAVSKAVEEDRFAIGGPVLGWALIDTDPETGATRLRYLHEGPWPSAEEAMAWLDAEEPLPAPPPMATQVRLGAYSSQLSVLSVSQGFASVVITRAAGERSELELLPCERLALLPLLAGPSPWGRDVPWAPPGWKP
jgi:hypothetical protein